MAKLKTGTRLRFKDRREPLRMVEIVGHTQNGYTVRTVVDSLGVEIEGRRSLVRAGNLLKLYEPVEPEPGAGDRCACGCRYDEHLTGGSSCRNCGAPHSECEWFTPAAIAKES